MPKSRIMIVEDEGIILQDLKITLEDLGYDIAATAVSGEEAIVKASEERPDLVLMDIVLIGAMDGVEAANKIKNTLNIPHIFLSSHSDKEMLDNAKVTEPFAYLTKPYHERDLSAAIEMALYRHNADELLFRREKQLAESQKVARLGSWEWDISANTIDWSDELYRLCGIHRADHKATFELLLKLVHPEDREQLEGSVNESLAYHKPYIADVRMVRPDGTEWIMEARGSAVYDDKGLPVLMSGTAQDVTDRKRVENELLLHREHLADLVKGKTSELKDSEKRYRGLFDIISSGVAVFEVVGDAVDFVFKDFNTSGEKIDRIHKEDVIGRRVTEVFPGVKDIGLFEVFQRVWKSGNSEYLPATLYEDARITGWRENYVYKLSSGEIVAVYDDVTKRVETERLLLESEKKYRSIFDNAANMITSVDSNGVIVDCNRTIKEVLGYSPDEIIGNSMSKIIHPEYLDKAGNSLKEIIERGYLYNHEYKMVRKDGSNIDVRINSSSLRNEDGEFERTVCIIEDTTERKRAKAEAIRASHLASLGELSAGVAHEINNPINGIINYAQILANRRELDERDRDIAERIIKEGNRISHITGGLLSFARDRKSSRQAINVKDVINSVLNLSETQLRKDGIVLTINVPDDLPLIVVQYQQIEQVFLNIISNARYSLNLNDQSARDEKRLEISAGTFSVGTALFIRVMFSDNGSGIPPEICDKVMDPFFTTKPSGSGTGLGLSISHGIINDHGGTISIESVEGAYTKIIIDLLVKN